MLILTLLLTAVISYLLGSCNSAIIVVKLLKHEDIREHGSKNAGLTNTLRCYGKVPALLTLIGDLAKGVVAVLISLQIAKLLMGADFESVHALVDKRTIGYISGLFSIIGHIFPLYYGFKRACFMLYPAGHRPCYILHSNTVFHNRGCYIQICFPRFHTLGSGISYNHILRAHVRV